MKFIKNKILFFLMFLLFICTGIEAWCLGPQGVSETVHNLSMTGPDEQLQSKDEPEICIFCHTPHGGSLDVALWNKDISVAGRPTYNHYTSETLSTEIAADHAANNIQDESMQCLTCHDGTISMYDVINPSNRTGSSPLPPDGLDAGKMNDFGLGVNGPVIGTNLTNDHPISFDYQPVYDDPTNLNALWPAADAKNKGIMFFGVDPVFRVECPSCHDPHVNYTWATGDQAYQPFLRTANTGSAMCLACHNK